MVKHHQVVPREWHSPWPVHQSYPKVKDKLSVNVPISSRISGQVRSPNLKGPYCSSSPFPMMTPMWVSSCQPINPISACSTTSNSTGEGTSKELTVSNNDLEALMSTNKSPVVDDSRQLKPSLLDRLSDHIQIHQMKRTMSMKKELASTSAYCCGTNPQTQTVNYWRAWHHPYRKPALCLRISLVTLNERGPPCSTVTDLSHSFLKPNGCHGPCSVMFFLKNNQRTALTEPPMMAASPLFSATITTSHLRRTYIGAPSEYFLHSATTKTTCILIIVITNQHHVLSITAQPQPHHAPHTFHVPGQSHCARTSLEVMSHGHHKDLRGFTSASFGTIRIWVSLLYVHSTTIFSSR